MSVFVCNAFLNILNPVGGSIYMSGSVSSSRCQDVISYHTITVIPTPSLQIVYFDILLGCILSINYFCVCSENLLDHDSMDTVCR